MISLKEHIGYAVSQVLLEIRSDFKWKKFKELKTQYERQQYLYDTNTQVLGTGSSRITFLLSNRYVLKLARPDEIEKGKAQNKEEVEVATDSKAAPVVAPIFDYAPDYSWIVSEVVRELESKLEFEEYTGLNFSKMFTYLTKVFDGKTPVNDIQYETDILEQRKQQFGTRLKEIEELLKKLPENDELREKLVAQQKFITTALNTAQEKLTAKTETYDKMVNHPIVKALVYMVKHKSAMIADWNFIDHWGKTASGKIVLLDYGYSREVSQKYYNRVPSENTGGDFDLPF